MWSKLQYFVNFSTWIPLKIHNFFYFFKGGLPNFFPKISFNFFKKKYFLLWWTIRKWNRILREGNGNGKLLPAKKYRIRFRKGNRCTSELFKFDWILYKNSWYGKRWIFLQFGTYVGGRFQRCKKLAKSYLDFRKWIKSWMELSKRIDWNE